MNLLTRNLNHGEPQTTALSVQQNRGLLVAGLTSATFSIVAALITLRWFILMKRTFRHKLVMFLIFSDAFKAFWYFIFPIVVFTRGPVPSTSKFCQVSGFFLAVGIEASDFAILMIALHSILYIFHPPATPGDSGGLYRWRYFVYPFWVALPLIVASLAFINHNQGYTTVGTYCYLPRRPFWYRLALSWIPRYCILLLIFTMYTAVYIYVSVKFRSFGSLINSDSEPSTSSNSRRSSMSMDDIAPDEPALVSPKKARFSRPASSRSVLEYAERPKDPWDEVNFITARGLRDTNIAATDFASLRNKSESTQNLTQEEPGIVPESRKVSQCPTTNTQWTGETSFTTPADFKRTSPPKPIDPLQRTRKAIRKQLRYLFIYPAVYVLMWTFPFVAHCLLYNDYYVSHPIYWLAILQTCSVSLQAAADCTVFSWREKPWRRVPENHRFSFSSTAFKEHSMRRSTLRTVDEERAVPEPLSADTAHIPSSHWWEAEGRKRKDSVWMGTDRRGTMSPDGFPSPILESTESRQNSVVLPDAVHMRSNEETRNA